MMRKIKALTKKKRQLFEKISNLNDMRRGTMVEQFFQKQRKDEKKVTLGPYNLYTYKEKGRTRSKRIPIELVPRYKEEINEFRKFEKLNSQLIEVCHQLCDLKIEHEEPKKSLSPKKNPEMHYP